MKNTLLGIAIVVWGTLYTIFLIQLYNVHIRVSLLTRAPIVGTPVVGAPVVVHTLREGGLRAGCVVDLRTGQIVSCPDEPCK